MENTDTELINRNIFAIYILKTVILNNTNNNSFHVCWYNQLICIMMQDMFVLFKDFFQTDIL